ncbi:MAG: hypothetical protein Q9159_002106 [Coniocarpon cinnabarinum]
MDPSTYRDPQLPLPDQWVIDHLLAREDGRDITPKSSPSTRHDSTDSGYASENPDPHHSSYLHEENHFPNSDLIKREEPTHTRSRRGETIHTDDHEPQSVGLSKTHHDSDVNTIFQMSALNDPESTIFVPTVFTTWDVHDLEAHLPRFVFDHVLTPYVLFAQKLARRPADVVFVTHLILYFTTCVPSAIILFCNFTWLHAVLHLVYQCWLIPTYTSMMHQHGHDRAILNSSMDWLDARFPYALDPLMGHTWNTHYFQHLKHQLVESNGPDDICSTIWYERDNSQHLAQYIARFTFLTWFGLAQDFFKKAQYGNAILALWSELSALVFVAEMTWLHWRAALFVLVLPMVFTRFMLTIETWGQRAFVDGKAPNSDFRNSVTLIDVQCNRHRFNAGYQTAHLLNPSRHWRDHPLTFLNNTRRYEQERALVFRNIDFTRLAYRLVRKDYEYLAKCMIPIGQQTSLSMDERMELLKSRTKAFSKSDIKEK